MKKITIALDWTPNVIHCGLLLALQHSYFEESDLEVAFISTEIDNYTRKPLTRVAEGEVDLAIGPTEHLFYLSILDENTPDLVALATVMQPNMSAFIVKQRPGLERPRDLDGKRYLGYNTPLEKHILQEMIKHDGGEGNFEMVTPPRLDVFEAFLQGKGEVAWVFKPWEAVLARHQGYDIREFDPVDFQVPYGYTTLIFTTGKKRVEKADEFHAFFKALAKGYSQAAEAPEKVAQLLCENQKHSNFNDPLFIERAMQSIAPSLLNEKNKWGIMEEERFDRFAEWLKSKGELTSGEFKKVRDHNIMDNSFLT